MNSLISRLQNWYQINCNGDWEHSYGISIETLDNPGWTIKIDLLGTCLENMSFENSFDNESGNLDWYHIKAEDNILKMACGSANLEQVLNIFFDTIIPQHASKKKFEIYLPIQNFENILWLQADCFFIDEETVEIYDIPKTISSQHIKFSEFVDYNVDELTVSYVVGNRVKVKLSETMEGVILTAR